MIDPFQSVKVLSSAAFMITFTIDEADSTETIARSIKFGKESEVSGN